MKNKTIGLAVLLLALLLTGCGAAKTESSAPSIAPSTAPSAAPSAAAGKTVADLGLADGAYTVDVTLSGGSGRASVASPAKLTIAGGKAVATIVWSSSTYDYMKVDGTKYSQVNTDGNAAFEIPVSAFDSALPVTADTVAMSTPHEIDYTLQFDAASIKAAEGAGA